jgi:hypothetical protein
MPWSAIVELILTVLLLYFGRTFVECVRRLLRGSMRYYTIQRYESVWWVYWHCLLLLC